jgi:hypothetical protein
MAGSGNVYHSLALIAQAAWSLRRDDPERAERDAGAAYATLRRLRMRGYYPHALVPLLRARTRLASPAAATQAAEAEAMFDAGAPVGILDLPLRVAITRAYRAGGREEEARRALVSARACLERRALRARDPVRRAAFLAMPEHRELLAPESTR